VDSPSLAVEKSMFGLLDYTLQGRRIISMILAIAPSMPVSTTGF